MSAFMLSVVSRRTDGVIRCLADDPDWGGCLQDKAGCWYFPFFRGVIANSGVTIPDVDVSLFACGCDHCLQARKSEFPNDQH